MLDFPLMQWVKLPVLDIIYPQSNKFATRMGVKNNSKLMTVLNCSFDKGDTGKPRFITDQYLQTLYVTSLLRIGGALFLNACKRCSDTSGKTEDQTKSTVLKCQGML